MFHLQLIHAIVCYNNYVLTQCYNVPCLLPYPSEDSDPPASKRNQGGIWMLITRDESALESDLPLHNSRGESKKAKHSDPSIPKSRRATVKLSTVIPLHPILEELHG